MKMKKIYIIVLAIAIMSVTFSCTEWLDIRPESEIVLDDFWQNEGHVNQVLAACYRSLTEYDVLSKMLIWGELRSDNVTFGNDLPTDMYKILNVDISPSNRYCHWGSFYTVINYCNNFLNYAPGVLDLDPNFNEEELKTMEAEVLTIRALVYFYLVRSFGKVPWIDNPSIDDLQNYRIPASDEEFILNKLITDLEQAKQLAKDKYEKIEYSKGRITKNAVRALLADIYLWTQNYGKCINMCDEILNDKKGEKLSLVDGENVISDVFYKGNSEESIFELQYKDPDLVNYVVRDFFGHYGDEKGQWSFPAVLVTGEASPFRYSVGNERESNYDLRKIDFLNKEQGGDKYYVFKYAGYSRIEITSTKYDYIYRNLTANWIVYRLSEIMLFKAEALIQLDESPDMALQLINKVYLRSNPKLNGVGLKSENYNTKLDMENLLYRERQRELMFEGKRWFDLMRLARREGSPSPLLNYVIKKFAGTGNIQLTKMSVMDALYMPVHTDELKANPELEQNPYYEIIGEE